jgi:hypothetical protein
VGELLAIISDFVADFLVCIPRFHHNCLYLYTLFANNRKRHLERLLTEQ